MTTAGVELPLSLFCGARITARLEYLNLYIKQINISGSVISVVIVHQDPNTLADTPIGSMSGTITADYQTLTLVSSNLLASGFLIVGSKDALSAIQGSHLLSYANGKIEDSLITTFTVPAVSSLNDIRGDADLEGVNILLADSSGDIALSTIDTTVLTSKADLGSKYNNCGSLIIERINTVAPDDAGNISIFGVDPVTIHVTASGLSVDTGVLVVADICSKTIKNTPPDDTTDVYHGNVTTATAPEWKGWPQYTP